MNKKIIYIFIFLINSINCYIKIPLKYIPTKEFNETNPSNILNSIISQKLYGSIEIGSPKQKIDVRIEFNSKNFYISKNDSSFHNLEKNLFYKLKIYNPHYSNSLKILEEGILFSDNILIMSSIAKDYFYFNNKKLEIEFILADVLEEPSSGGIGLQLFQEELSTTNINTESFFEIMKNKGIINNYSWTIIYNNKEGYDGYLFIGDYLHNIDNNDLFLNEKKYYKNYLNSIYAYTYDNVIKTEFDMDELIIYKRNENQENSNEIIKDSKYLHTKLDYNFLGIVGPQFIRIYLENNILTDKNGCNKDNFFLEGKRYFFYYWEKNNLIIKKLKNIFPKIQFINYHFNSNFTILPDDLFIEKDKYIYCLMLFVLSGKDEWILGTPFVKKYQFMYEQESKRIFYYSSKNVITIDGIDKLTLIKIIIILFVIFTLLGFFIGRIIYKRHFKKLRINELDENYEYNSYDNNKNNKEIKEIKIEMTKKIFNE